LRYIRGWALVVVVLIAFGACSSGNENELFEETATESPRARSRSEDVSPTDVARPKPGEYVYDVSGLGATNVPEGTQLIERLEVSGDLYNITVTNTRNRNAQRIQLRWESNRVVQLSNETIIGGQRRTCTYDPPLEILHIPMTAEPFNDQSFSSTTCESKIEIEVLDRDSVQDANGKAWGVWVIEVRSEAAGRTDVRTRWFSPELGRDIRIQTTTDTAERQDQTEQILARYPGPI
jgi:hypothetical protein